MCVDSKFKLSIITVVKDDLEGFERTINSLNSALHELDTQELQLIESVVVDGSYDQQLIPTLSESAPFPLQYLWVKPEGVYAAMNAGIKIARGEYVYFLNSGDELAGTDSLDVIMKSLVTNPAWAFGQVIFRSPDGTQTSTTFDYPTEKRHLFGRGKFPAHQGMVASLDLVNQLGGFDSSYEIAGDYKLALQLSTFADPIKIDQPIAIFHLGGISSSNWQESLNEFHNARVAVFTLRGAALVPEYVRWRSLYLRMWLARKIGRVNIDPN